VAEMDISKVKAKITNSECKISVLLLYDSLSRT